MHHSNYGLNFSFKTIPRLSIILKKTFYSGRSRSVQMKLDSSHVITLFIREWQHY